MRWTGADRVVRNNEKKGLGQAFAVMVDGVSAGVMCRAFKHMGVR